MVELSVIIPVYNTADTLNRCVESVRTQNVREMEIILIDDGSPDSSPTLCDRLSENDSRIKVIHKNNGGLSDARNAGLDIAQGEYVTFVDSDDYLLPGTYPPLLEFLRKNENVNILEFSIRFEKGKQTTPALNDCIFQTSTDYWLSTRAWQHTYACNKFFKRWLFDKSRFAKDRIFEDLLLFPALLKNCIWIATTSHGTYVYTDNPNGLSKDNTTRSICGLLRAELKAAWTMRTLPWNRNGWNLYYCILCRIHDIVRLSLLHHTHQ